MRKEREREKKKEREREKKKETERERDFKYLLTLILTGGSQVTLINPNFSEWKSVGLELTIPMMYHT